MSINVLILTSEYPPLIVGGLGTHVFELQAGLRRLGCDVTVLAPTTGKTEQHHETNLSVHWISMTDSLNRGSLAAATNDCVSYGLNLIAQSKDQPTIIHCHDWLSFPAAHQIARILKIPMVGTVHLLYGSRPLWGEVIDNDVIRIERELCQQSLAVITVSESMRELMRSLHAIPENKIHVIYNGMNPGLFLEASANLTETARLKKSFAPDGEKIILFAGRIVPQKGIAALLESAAKVIARNENVRYLIAGSHPDVPIAELPGFYRERYPQYSNLLSKLQFLGMVSRPELAQLYQVADVAVVPSLYEPFGYAAVEAMAAGVPVIATNVGGLAEVVVPGETGLLVPTYQDHKGQPRVDVGKLTEAQLFLLRNESTARQMGAAGKQRALKEFGQEKMAESVNAVYREVLASRPQRSTRTAQLATA